MLSAGYYAQRGDANAVKKGMDAMAQSGVIHHEKYYYFGLC